MKGLSLFRIASLMAFISVSGIFAHAAAASTPQQLQALIVSGHEKAALGELRDALRTHPHSGVAWYLVAEAQDASGNRIAARNALAKAEQYAPGLPFAQPNKVAALKAHLAAPAARRGFGFSPFAIVIGALVILFILVRLFLRSRRSMPPPGFQSGYGAGSPGGPPGSPYGAGGGMPYGAGVGMPASGVGGSLVSGLAAGAGFAAGERVIEGLTGGGLTGGGLTGGSRAESPIDPGPASDPVPDRDDGLTGSPNWDNGDSGAGGSDALDNGGEFDPDNNW
jgi:hypothetical protein